MNFNDQWKGIYEATTVPQSRKISEGEAKSEEASKSKWKSSRQSSRPGSRPFVPTSTDHLFRPQLRNVKYGKKKTRKHMF
jgi:hypothetical protein